MTRADTITCAEAIREATDQAMADDDRVFIVGEGVPDPKGIFGTTLGLREKYGPERVMDMPVSENAVTGMCVGAALKRLRPIMAHQRVDFSLYSFDQIINNAAKWHFMFGGQSSVPLVIRMIIGRGWGQGAQHSQNLQALFAHIPGLKVVMPATAYDAKGLLVAAVEDENPVIFLEHRWLHRLTGRVPRGKYRLPLGKAKIARKGRDITVAASSYMTIESLRAARELSGLGVEVEVVDFRTVKPLDAGAVVSSVQKTGRLVAADSGWSSFGAAAEVLARAAEAGCKFKAPPRRVALPDMPTPSSPALTKQFYPTYKNIVEEALDLMGEDKKAVKDDWRRRQTKNAVPHDVPDLSFTGPF